jgi:DNA-binding XRE family transcriptional regulator
MDMFLQLRCGVPPTTVKSWKMYELQHFKIILIVGKKCRIPPCPQDKKARNCSELTDIVPVMSVLEIIAEQRLGAKNLAGHPRLRAALQRIDNLARRKGSSEDEKARIASIVELCFAYERESDSDEKANILRTLEEISENEPLELPTETIEEWEGKLVSKERAFAKEKAALARRQQEFRRKYFSFRAKAGLQTQQDVAKRAGLRRSYVAVIEAGVHSPQQKTLQKLAKAFNVDVAELLA